MALLSQGSSVMESPEDKGASVPCVRGSAKISRRVTLALYTMNQQGLQNGNLQKTETQFLLRTKDMTADISKSPNQTTDQ